MRKGPARPFWDLWKATQSAWNYTKGVLDEEFPFIDRQTHRKIR